MTVTSEQHAQEYSSNLKTIAVIQVVETGDRVPSAAVVLAVAQSGCTQARMMMMIRPRTFTSTEAWTTLFRVNLVKQWRKRVRAGNFRLNARSEGIASLTRWFSAADA